MTSEFRLPKALKYEELTKESHDIFNTQDMFQGFKLEFQKSLARNFGVAHVISLGKTHEPKKLKRDYAIMANLALKDGVVIGRYKTNEDFLARAIYQIRKNSLLMLTSVSQQSQHGEIRVFEAELSTNPLDSQLNFKLSIEQTPMGSGPILNVSYSKRIMRDFSVGIDYSYLPTNGAAMLGATARLEWSKLNPNIAEAFHKRTTRIKNRIKDIRKVRDLDPEEMATFKEVTFEPRCVLTMTLQSHNFEFTYSYKPTDKFALGSALTFAQNPQPGSEGFESSWKFGYTFESGFVSAKGVVTDLNTFDSLLEQKLGEHIGVVLSSQADLAKDLYTFGLGINYVVE